MLGAKRQFTIVDSHMPEINPGSSRTTKGTNGTPNFMGGRVAPLNTVSITASGYVWMRIVTSRDDQRLTQMVLKLKLAVRNPNRVLRNGARSYAPVGYRGGRHVWRR